jgi:putative ABC transport system ATP-binding protein
MTLSAAVDPMVLLQGVELTLKSDAGEINILRGIDLSVGIGESVGVVGPSGSGKTSMIMVIAGLERISSGRISVGNREISALNEDALAVFRRDEIGVVFQSFHLIPTMTALENVAVPMELANRRDAFERAEQALRDVGLGHRIQHYPGQLSGGEQQRVALARAFAVEPNLLLADEPTGNLDGETGGHIVEMLFELAERAGTTLMLITHDNAIAERCDRIVRMVDGQLA